MTHIARQRIKKGGDFFLAGDKIELTKEELAALPEGAVMPDPEADSLAPAPSADAQADRLRAAVAALPASAFKKDGGIRAGDLRDLIEVLGFDVSEEQVAAVKSADPAGAD